MREIKFRAWARYGEMFPNVQNHINGDWAFGNMLMKPDEFTIMQYTGLKDKNGVEIYEGDIIKFRKQALKKYITGEVEYMCAEFRVSHDTANPLLSGDVYDIQVIGNIHENPELLK